MHQRRVVWRQRGLWLFRRHRAGFSFVNAQGVWIDAHQNVGYPELFDTWQLMLFFESVGEDEFEYEQLESELARLTTVKKLTKRTEGCYSLRSIPNREPVFEGGVEDYQARAQRTNQEQALVKLVANALCEIRLRLRTGRQDGIPPSVAIAGHLAYALHNEALALLGEPDEADVAGALKRIDAIDDDFKGEHLRVSFDQALQKDPSPD